MYPGLSQTIFSDEAYATDWYCRVGVVLSPNPAFFAECQPLFDDAALKTALANGTTFGHPPDFRDRVTSRIRLLHAQGRLVMTPARMLSDELSGTRIVKAAASGVAPHDAEARRIALALCDLVGNGVDIIVVAQKVDSTFTSRLNAGARGVDRRVEQHKRGKTDLKIGCSIEANLRFLLACESWLTKWSNRLGRSSHPCPPIALSGSVCIDTIAEPQIRAAFVGYGEVLRHWLSRGPGYAELIHLGRVYETPSVYELFTQLADVYAAFIVTSLAGGESTYLDALKARSDVEWRAHGGNSELWLP